MWFSICYVKDPMQSLIHTKIKILPSVVMEVGIHIVRRTTLNSSRRLFSLLYSFLYSLIPNTCCIDSKEIITYNMLPNFGCI